MNGAELVNLSENFRCFAPPDPSGRFYELNFIFDEIFKTDTYKFDVAAIPDDGVVLDVGANVGIFTAFVKSQKPQATVIAFEPIEVTFEALLRNIELHEMMRVTSYPMALGGKDEDEVEFTYYSIMPGNSTRFPEMKAPQLARYATAVKVPMKTLSYMLSKHPEIDSVDLIKIDVEGGELDLLEGISFNDWPKIKSFVIEIKDKNGELAKLRRVLEGRGYVVEASFSPMIPEEKRMFIVHAVKRQL